jgi:hypothetical protein
VDSTLKQAVTPSFQILSHSLFMSLDAIWAELLKTSRKKPQSNLLQLGVLVTVEEEAG